nr:type II toxin-antitoxin system RelE/ParE family toxin [Paenibacillus sp. F411]
MPIAEEDLLNIIHYIMLDNPEAALLMADKIDQSISILETFPYCGAIPKDTRLQILNYRMLLVESYLVFYVVLGDIVEIRRILHGKRKYNFLM